MKYAYLILLSFLVACASKTAGPSFSLDYDKVFRLEVGKTTEADAVKTFGSPASRSEKNEYYTLIYNSPSTNHQRLSMNFGKNKVLMSFLWIPSENEKESSLAGAKSVFKEAKFKVTEEDSSSPHMVSKVVLYTDEKSGTIIRYNPSSNLVEAIAKYDGSLRSPAGDEKQKKAPYTFGDESSTLSR
jgi:hypothetical protein